MKRAGQALAACLLASNLALVACVGGGGGSSAAPAKRAAAAVQVVAGDAQSGVVGQELPQALVVKVVDAAGAPVDGQIVNFRVTEGGGTVFAGAALSDANGEARERWTLGTAAGAQRLEARAVDATGTAVVFGSFSATAVAGPAQAVVVAGGDQQSAQQLTPVQQSLRVRVTDAYGNPVSGVSVAFVPGAGFGSASPASATTGADGTASTQWTLGAPLDAQALEARVTGLTPVSFSATATRGPVQARITLVSGGDQTGAAGAPLPAPIVVRLTDLSDSPLAGRQVEFETTAWSGTVDGSWSTSVVTDDAGLAQVRWTLGTEPSPQELFARAIDPISQRPAGIQINAISVAGPAAALKVSVGFPAPSTPRTVPVWVSLADQFGNLVDGVQVSLTPASGSGTVNPGTVTSSKVNSVRADWTAGFLVGDQTLTADAAGLSTTVTRSLTFGQTVDGTYPIFVTLTSGDPTHCTSTDPTARTPTVLTVTNGSVAPDNFGCGNLGCYSYRGIADDGRFSFNEGNKYSNSKSIAGQFIVAGALVTASGTLSTYWLDILTGAHDCTFQWSTQPP